MIAAFLTPFLSQSIQGLQSDPAQESLYYQQQSLVILEQISKQIASLTPQVPIILNPPPPYPPFRPSFSDIRVNIYLVSGLVCSLSAALLAILIQQWVRSYMHIFQHYDHPLKRARFRQFFLEGAKRMQSSAEAVPRLIQLSLFLFFLGLGDSMIYANKVVGTTTIVLICVFGVLYLYNASGQLKGLESPLQTLTSHLIIFCMQIIKRPYSADNSRKWYHLTSNEAYQENLVMEETEGRKERDVRSIQWLLENTTVNAEMEPLVLAIPGTFNTEWGREVWMDVLFQGSPKPTDRSAAGDPTPLIRPLAGTSVDTLCRCVRNFFESCNDHSSFASEEARRRRMHTCVEVAASLVCGIGFQLEWLGEIGKLVSEIGHIENINQPPTSTPDPSFIVRWTCLSLVVIHQILSSSLLRVSAGYALNGLARLQPEYGDPEEVSGRSAQRIEECLKSAWKHVEELRLALKHSTEWTSGDQVKDILRKYERQISELERMKVEADCIKAIDWRITLYQAAMDQTTFKLARQLPGVSFDEPCHTESFLISDTFNLPTSGGAALTPQLILPGQQIQTLARLGLKLREILDGQVDEGYEEVLENLKSVDQVPYSLRRPNGLMKRQLWRLQDLRDGGGLGFTVELFFLSLRQLLSIPSLHKSNSVFYIGAFKIIASHWKESKGSTGTYRTLLNILCDLIIRDRGDFSNFLYPEPITTELLDMVKNMLQGNAGLDDGVRYLWQEIADVDPGNCMDSELRDAVIEVRKSIVMV